MPSYFNSEEAIRVFFMKETNTAEQKKLYNKLLRIWSRAVRVGGTKGGFYYQRSCSTIKGKAILIFEPQGGVDNGIFQEISRIGETLEGRFVCTKNGYIELHIQKDLNDSNLIKYSRSIRKIIASISGIMSGGSDDRVKIITPKVKARKLKEEQLQKQRIREEQKALKQKKKDDADEKKRLREERKKAAEELREKNKQKRLERAAKKALDKNKTKRKEATKKKRTKVENETVETKKTKQTTADKTPDSNTPKKKKKKRSKKIKSDVPQNEKPKKVSQKKKRKKKKKKKKKTKE
jgi:hypothetical protein